MRILQLVSQTRVGGAETFALQLSEALRDRGHEVRLLANRHNCDLFERRRDAGSRGALPCRAFPRRSRLDARFPIQLAGEIRGFRPHVLHAHNRGPNAWARALGALFPRMTVFCHYHSGKIVGRESRRFALERTLARRRSVAIAVSAEIAETLRHAGANRPDRIHQVPVGIDTSRFRDGGPAVPGSGGTAERAIDGVDGVGGVGGVDGVDGVEGRAAAGAARNAGNEAILPEGARGRPRILHVASLTPVKNHALLLEAFTGVAARSRAVLLLAGEGALRGEIEARAAREDLRGRVFLLGNRSDIPELLRLAEASVLPSTAEGLPLSVLESMAAGTCPVASRVGEIPTVIEDGRTGLLVRPGDADDLERALLQILEDPSRARRMGEAAREVVEERYSIVAIAERIEALYEAEIAREGRFSESAAS